MPGIAHVGDVGSGICYSPDHSKPTPYTTVFVSGSGTVFANDEAVASIGTIGVASCGHSTLAIVGSDTVFSENEGVHRLGDIGVNYGPYTVISSSDDVFANE